MNRFVPKFHRLFLSTLADYITNKICRFITISIRNPHCAHFWSIFHPDPEITTFGHSNSTFLRSISNFQCLWSIFNTKYPLNLVRKLISLNFNFQNCHNQWPPPCPIPRPIFGKCVQPEFCRMAINGSPTMLANYLCNKNPRFISKN